MSGIVSDNIEGVSGIVQAAVAIEILTIDPTVNPLPAWSAANKQITGMNACLGVGTQTAALAAGGEIFGGPNPVAISEEYDGTCWAAANSMNNAQSQAPGYGIQTAAGIVGGGVNPAVNTELYDGTSWATSVAQPEALKNLPGTSGTTSAAFCCGGGSNYPTPSNATTYEWNGSAWSGGGALPDPRFDIGGCGTVSAGLCAGGSYGGGTGANNYNRKTTEEYDGTSWSSAQNLLSGRTGVSGGLLGIQTDAMIFLGNTDYGSSDYGGLLSTENYDGTAWSVNPAVCLYKGGNASGGNTSAAVQWRTDDGIGTAYCQEYNLASTDATSGSLWYNSSEKRLKVATNIGVWTSATNYPAAYAGVYGAGTQTAALLFGGESTGSPSQHVETYEYDGTSWSAGGDLTETPAACQGVGTQGAGFKIGGQNGPITANCQQYNGSTWSNTNSLTTARRNFCAWGTTYSAGCSSGHLGGSSYQSGSEEFDGTSWSSAATELQTVSSVAAFGSSSVDGIKVAGYNSNSTIPAMDFVEHFDGVCWSSRNVVLVRRWNHRTSIQGTSSAAIIFGGKQVTDVFGGYSGYGGTTEEYDGVVWLSRGTMNNAVYSTGYAGTSSAALSVGGYDAANNLIAYVEEYTVGSGAYNAIINLH